MKIGRVVYQNSVRMALVDEAAQRVELVGGSSRHHDNPVLAVIEQRIGESELRGRVETSAAFSEVRFLAPFSAMRRNILAVGKNYHEHAAEFDRSGFNATRSESSIPAFPQFFSKATTTLSGPTDDIEFCPSFTDSVDYEGEIGVVISRECREVTVAQAMDHVYGHVVLNDVTARDLQRNHAQWFLGKSLDTFCPMGPWISTESHVASELELQTWVNGELRQSARFSELIFDVPTLVATLSRAMPLLPGDVIATGTPVGVGVGFSPPRFLRDGDEVRVQASGLGSLCNRVHTRSARR